MVMNVRNVVTFRLDFATSWLGRLLTLTVGNITMPVSDMPRVTIRFCSY